MGITAAGSGSIEAIVPAPRSPGSAAVARPRARRCTPRRAVIGADGALILCRVRAFDDLPQLINMLFGRMLLVRPGMAGLRQVGGRSDLSWEESVRLDLRSAENWSPALDAMTPWKTIGAVLHGRGAY